MLLNGALQQLHNQISILLKTLSVDIDPKFPLNMISPILQRDAGDAEEMGNVGNLRLFPLLRAAAISGESQGLVKSVGQRHFVLPIH